ncbi:MAG: DEAD/DEAH box helicase family protein, partial [Candidatus Omnitrophota bacterium]
MLALIYMNTSSIKYKIFSRLTAGIVLVAFTINTVFQDAALAGNASAAGDTNLAVWTAIERANVNRHMLAEMYRATSTWPADNAQYLAMLARSGHKAVLLPNGRYLVAGETEGNDIALIRAILAYEFDTLVANVKEQPCYESAVKAVSGDMEAVRAYCASAGIAAPEGALGAELSHRLLVKAFELYILIDKDIVIPQSDLTKDEQRFYDSVKEIVARKTGDSGSNGFPAFFYSAKERGGEVRRIKGVRQPSETVQRQDGPVPARGPARRIESITPVSIPPPETFSTPHAEAIRITPFDPRTPPKILSNVVQGDVHPTADADAASAGNREHGRVSDEPAAAGLETVRYSDLANEADPARREAFIDLVTEGLQQMAEGDRRAHIDRDWVAAQLSEHSAPNVTAGIQDPESTGSRYEYIILFRENEPVGYAFFTYCSRADVVLHHLYVKEQNRRAGIGRLLWSRFMDALSADNILDVSVNRVITVSILGKKDAQDFWENKAAAIATEFADAIRRREIMIDMARDSGRKPVQLTIVLRPGFQMSPGAAAPRPANRPAMAENGSGPSIPDGTAPTGLSLNAVWHSRLAKTLIILSVLAALSLIFATARIYPAGTQLSDMPEFLTAVGIIYTALVLAGAYVYRQTKDVWNYKSRFALAGLSLLAAGQFAWTSIFPHMVIRNSGAGLYISALYPVAVLLICYVYPFIAGTGKASWIPFINEFRVLQKFHHSKVKLVEEVPVLRKLSGFRGLKWIAGLVIPASAILLVGSFASQPLAAPLMYWSFSMKPKVEPVEWAIILQISVVLPLILEWLRGKKPGWNVWLGTAMVCSSVIGNTFLGAAGAASALSVLKWSTLIALVASVAYGLQRFLHNWAYTKAEHPDRVKAAATIGYLLGIGLTLFYTFGLGILKGSGSPYLVRHLITSSAFNAVAFSAGWMLMLFVMSTYNSLTKERKTASFSLPLLVTILGFTPLLTALYQSLILQRWPSMVQLVFCVVGILGITVANMATNRSERISGATGAMTGVPEGGTRQPESGAAKIDLSIIIPAHNEGRTIEEVINRIIESLGRENKARISKHAGEIVYEIIAVNDGSTDATGDIINRLHGEGKIQKVVHHSRQKDGRGRGKGAAFRSGLIKASGEVTIVQDADMEYHPEDIPRVVNPILQGDYDAAYGDRELDRKGFGLNILLYLENIVSRLIGALLSGKPVLEGWKNPAVKDATTCYKAARTELLYKLLDSGRLKENTYNFDLEFTSGLLGQTARIANVPLSSYRPRTRAEGKHLGYIDILRWVKFILINTGRVRRLAEDISFMIARRRAGRLKAVAIDWDGTISKLRHGWQDLMLPYLASLLASNPLSDEEWGMLVEDMKNERWDHLKFTSPAIEDLIAKGRLKEAEVDAARQLILDTTGDPTPAQFMAIMRQRLKQEGRLTEETESGLEESVKPYIRTYKEHLDKVVSHRIRMFSDGDIGIEDILYPAAVQCLRYCKEHNIPAHVVTGSDTEGVRREAAVLGLQELITDVTGYDIEKKIESKADVIKSIKKRYRCAGLRLGVIGDGKVEASAGMRGDISAFTIALISDDNKLILDKIHKCKPHLVIENSGLARIFKSNGRAGLPGDSKASEPRSANRLAMAGLVFAPGAFNWTNLLIAGFAYVTVALIIRWIDTKSRFKGRVPKWLRLPLPRLAPFALMAKTGVQDIGPAAFFLANGQINIPAWEEYFNRVSALLSRKLGKPVQIAIGGSIRYRGTSSHDLDTNMVVDVEPGAVSSELLRRALEDCLVAGGKRILVWDTPEDPNDPKERFLAGWCKQYELELGGEKVILDVFIHPSWDAATVKFAQFILGRVEDWQSPKKQVKGIIAATYYFDAICDNAYNALLKQAGNDELTVLPQGWGIRARYLSLVIRSYIEDSTFHAFMLPNVIARMRRPIAEDKFTQEEKFRIWAALALRQLKKVRQALIAVTEHSETDKRNELYMQLLKEYHLFRYVFGTLQNMGLSKEMPEALRLHNLESAVAELRFITEDCGLRRIIGTPQQFLNAMSLAQSELVRFAWPPPIDPGDGAFREPGRVPGSNPDLSPKPPAGRLAMAGLLFAPDAFGGALSWTTLFIAAAVYVTTALIIRRINTKSRWRGRVPGVILRAFPLPQVLPVPLAMMAVQDEGGSMPILYQAHPERFRKTALALYLTPHGWEQFRLSERQYKIVHSAAGVFSEEHVVGYTEELYQSLDAKGRLTSFRERGVEIADVCSVPDELFYETIRIVADDEGVEFPRHWMLVSMPYAVVENEGRVEDAGILLTEHSASVFSELSGDRPDDIYGPLINGQLKQLSGMLSGIVVEEDTRPVHVFLGEFVPRYAREFEPPESRIPSSEGLPPLRGHQKEALEKAERLRADVRDRRERRREKLADGEPAGEEGDVTYGTIKALLVHPTGSGKTRVAAEDAKRVCGGEFRKKVLYLIHNRPVLEQSLGVFKEVWPQSNPCILRAGMDKSRVFENSQAVFMTCQYLTEHIREFSPGDFDYIIIDEAHRAGNDTYQRIMHRFRPSFMLGLTGTSVRTEGVDVSVFFDGNVVDRKSLQDMADGDVIPPVRYLRVRTDLEAKLSRIGIDYSGKSLEYNLNVPSRNRLVVSQFKDLEKGRVKKTKGPVRGLCYCVTVQHAMDMVDYFRGQGVKAMVVHGGMSDDDVRDAIKAFRQGEVQVLCSRDILNEGMDFPEADVLLMARPTMSRIIYEQQLGRGLRTDEDKEALWVVDFVDNVAVMQAPLSLLGALAGQGYPVDREYWDGREVLAPSRRMYRMRIRADVPLEAEVEELDAYKLGISALIPLKELASKLALTEYELRTVYGQGAEGPFGEEISELFFEVQGDERGGRKRHIFAYPSAVERIKEMMDGVKSAEIGRRNLEDNRLVELETIKNGPPDDMAMAFFRVSSGRGAKKKPYYRDEEMMRAAFKYLDTLPCKVGDETVRSGPDSYEFDGCAARLLLEMGGPVLSAFLREQFFAEKRSVYNWLYTAAILELIDYPLDMPEPEMIRLLSRGLESDFNNLAGISAMALLHLSRRGKRSFEDSGNIVGLVRGELTKTLHKEITAGNVFIKQQYLKSNFLLMALIEHYYVLSRIGGPATNFMDIVVDYIPIFLYRRELLKKCCTGPRGGRLSNLEQGKSNLYDELLFKCYWRDTRFRSCKNRVYTFDALLDEAAFVFKDEIQRIAQGVLRRRDMRAFSGQTLWTQKGDVNGWLLSGELWDAMIEPNKFLRDLATGAVLSQYRGGRPGGGRWPVLEWVCDGLYSHVRGVTRSDKAGRLAGYVAAPALMESVPVALFTIAVSLAAAVFMTTPPFISQNFLIFAVWVPAQIAWHLMHAFRAPPGTNLKKALFGEEYERLVMSFFIALFILYDPVMNPYTIGWMSMLLIDNVLSHMILNLLYVGDGAFHEPGHATEGSPELRGNLSRPRGVPDANLDLSPRAPAARFAAPALLFAPGAFGGAFSWTNLAVAAAVYVALALIIRWINTRFIPVPGALMVNGETGVPQPTGDTGHREIASLHAGSSGDGESVPEDAVQLACELARKIRKDVANETFFYTGKIRELIAVFRRHFP